MSKSFTHNGLVSLAIVAGLVFGFGTARAVAQMNMQGHAMSGQGMQHAAGAMSPARTQQTPHAGQLSRTARHTVEVVYQPKQTRVYLYGPTGAPISARGIQGQLAMQVRGNDKIYRFPLSYVAPAAGSTSQDYLEATVDVSHIRDGDMTVTIELMGLPQEPAAQTRVTQTFAISKPRLQVTVAQLTAADQAGIARQQVCPVTGSKLGAMGTPVKVLVGDRPVYLCCKGCLSKIQANPGFYLQKVSTSAGAAAHQISVSTATAADQAAIARQQVCPVSGNRLGMMGAPVKVTIDGKALFLCCRGCVRKFQANPDHYLAEAARLTGQR